MATPQAVSYLAEFVSPEEAAGLLGALDSAVRARSGGGPASVAAKFTIEARRSYDRGAPINWAWCFWISAHGVQSQT